MERKVVVITGPTCSGKTKLSLLLSELLDSEIVSADSRQIYRYLDIGTAKPDCMTLKKVPHHFINILNPDEDYNVSRFENEAVEVINGILLKNKQPVITGGSGLYIRALVDGLFEEVDTDLEFREYLQNIRKENGNVFLYEMLKEKDAEGAGKMFPSNWKRVIRALEVLHLSGKPIWQHHKEQTGKNRFNFIQYGLEWNREILYSMIERRVDEMLEAGLVNEVQNLLKEGYSTELNSLNTVGYKEIIAYLNGDYTLDRAIELIKRNTRRYAKRQLTWFRKDDRIVWKNISSENDLQVLAEEIAVISTFDS